LEAVALAQLLVLNRNCSVVIEYTEPIGGFTALASRRNRKEPHIVAASRSPLAVRCMSNQGHRNSGLFTDQLFPA
jgi:hypothetical protein